MTIDIFASPGLVAVVDGAVLTAASWPGLIKPGPPQPVFEWRRKSRRSTFPADDGNARWALGEDRGCRVDRVGVARGAAAVSRPGRVGSRPRFCELAALRQNRAERPRSHRPERPPDDRLHGPRRRRSRRAGITGPRRRASERL